MINEPCSYGNVGELYFSDKHGARLDEGEPGVVEEGVLVLIRDVVRHIPATITENKTWNVLPCIH